MSRVGWSPVCAGITTHQRPRETWTLRGTRQEPCQVHQPVRSGTWGHWRLDRGLPSSARRTTSATCFIRRHPASACVPLVGPWALPRLKPLSLLFQARLLVAAGYACFENCSTDAPDVVVKSLHADGSNIPRVSLVARKGCVELM